MIQYSFIEHPFLSLHEYVSAVLPGIEKIVSIYYNEETKVLESQLSERKKKKYIASAFDISKIKEGLNKLRINKNPYGWYSIDDVPLEINDNNQNTILNELKNIVLLIKVPNGEDGKNDLVFLYFNENHSNFGMSKSDTPLTTENKTIIAHVLTNSIRIYISEKYANREALKKNNSRANQIFGELGSLKAELNNLHEDYGLSMVKLCRQYLHDFGNQHQKTYHLSDGAIEKIKQYKGDLRNLEFFIRETVIFLNNLHFNKIEIIILEWYLNFDKAPQSEGTEEEIVAESRYVKTIDLLDRLEKAARKVKLNHLKLTSVNIGKALDKPISAPAISDALSNHKGKIKTLLNSQPEKWLTIRNEFRPLRNIIS